MPNKDMNRSQTVDAKVLVVPTQHGTTCKPAASLTKAVVNKVLTRTLSTRQYEGRSKFYLAYGAVTSLFISMLVTTTGTIRCRKDNRNKCIKDTVMSPGPPTPTLEEERTELLGSLTTEQQQRTSARVIKKLRLEPPGSGDKRGKKEGVSDDLQECETPLKLDDKELKFPTVKQRMPKALWSTDEKNYFFEALNEYGKDFDAITAHICAKMKKKGMPDANLKTKTQVSHFYYRTWHKLSKHVHFDENVKKVAQELYALINYGELRKKLSSVPEKTCARLGEMVRGGSMAVRARGRTLRVRTPMCRALRSLNQITEGSCGLRVCSVLAVLRARSAGAWGRVQRAAHNPRAAVALPLRVLLRTLLAALARRWTRSDVTKLSDSTLEDVQKDAEEYDMPCERDRELEEHLNLETDRIILQEQKSKKLALHLGPRPGAEIHLPVVSPSEQLSSQKICFSSYLERMESQRDKDGHSKIRTPKRSRKDSTTEKDKESDPKRIKSEDLDKLVNIEETAIDGIELMANYKSQQEDEEKPSTEDEKDRDITEEDGDRETEREKDIPERDKDIQDKDTEREKELLERDKDMSEREKDSFSEMEDDEKYNKSDTDNESDHGKEKSGKDTKFKNLKVKFRIRPKKRGGSIYTLVVDNPDEGRDPKVEGHKEEDKHDVDVEMAYKQIRKGWSVYDAGELTIGDLYLMFGSRSKIELDYWWAEPTPPLPQPQKSSPTTDRQVLDKKSDKLSESDKKSEKLSELDKKSDKGADSSVEDEKEKARESDNDILSPKNTYSQDSNDGMSGDERKSEQLLSPEHKSSSTSLKLVSKLINRPTAPAPQDGFSLVSDRLRRLLALAGNPHVGVTSNSRCDCGHVCGHRRQQVGMPQKPPAAVQYCAPAGVNDPPAVFRHPTPIAPRPDTDHNSRPELVLDGVPRWRRGRPAASSRRVVVQRLLPLLPKLPQHNLIPVKVPNTPPAPPRILPKPPPTSTSDLSFFYVLSESNGQFFFHDGDRRIPITPLPGDGTVAQPLTDGEETSEETDKDNIKVELISNTSECKKEPDSNIEPVTKTEVFNEASIKTDPVDKAELVTDSLSLSPSRLLQEGAWLDATDFSLSSFLSHLDARPHADLAVDSQLQSLMAESSVDYVAKFADLAAEVTKEPDPPTDKLP